METEKLPLITSTLLDLSKTEQYRRVIHLIATSNSSTSTVPRLCFQAIRCTLPSCPCECFSPGKSSLRSCETCKHGWVAHGKYKFKILLKIYLLWFELYYLNFLNYQIWCIDARSSQPFFLDWCGLNFCNFLMYKPNHHKFYPIDFWFKLCNMIHIWNFSKQSFCELFFKEFRH